MSARDQTDRGTDGQRDIRTEGKGQKPSTPELSVCKTEREREREREETRMSPREQTERDIRTEGHTDRGQKPSTPEFSVC